jgi:hypothetical protein
MNRRRALAAIAIAVLGGGIDARPHALSALGTTDPVEGQSLTVFPTAIAVEAQRGERIDRSIGIVQTGREERRVTFEVLGDASPFVTIIDPGTGESVDHLEAVTHAPTYVVVRIAPTAPIPDGEINASIEIRAVDDDVVVGSRLDLRVDVAGDRALRVRIDDVSLPDAIEAGRPLPVSLTAAVDGNVDLVPEISLALDGPDGHLRELTARPPVVEPGGLRIIDVVWPTEGWAVGHHRGRLTLRAGPDELDSAELAVDVIPSGSLLRGVAVLRATVVSDPRPHSAVKIEVEVRNEGALAGRTIFAGDLMYDSHAVSPLRSDPVLIESGEVATLVVYAQLDEAGTYEVRGRANLDGADSSMFGVRFDATPERGSSWKLLAAAVALLSVVGVSALALRSRR